MEAQLEATCGVISQTSEYAAEIFICALEDLFGDAFYYCMSGVGRLVEPDPETLHPFHLAEKQLKYASMAKRLAGLRAKKASNQPYDERKLPPRDF